MRVSWNGPVGLAIGFLAGFLACAATASLRRGWAQDYYFRRYLRANEEALMKEYASRSCFLDGDRFVQLVKSESAVDYPHLASAVDAVIENQMAAEVWAPIAAKACLAASPSDLAVLVSNFSSWACLSIAYEIEGQQPVVSRRIRGNRREAEALLRDVLREECGE